MNHSESLFETVLNTVSDGVNIVDTDLKIIYHNMAITRTCGSSLAGRFCYEAFWGRDKPCEDCKIVDVLKDGLERRTFRDLRLPSGDLRLIELRSAAIRDAADHIIGAVEVARDVTEQKKAQALLNRTLLQQNVELERLNQELSDAAGYVKTVLPRALDQSPVRTEWKFVPSAALGGDAFGYHWLDADHFAIYLLDVSGHGWGASLLAVSVINILRSHALPDIDFRLPEQVLYSLNNTFPSEKHNDLFFTIWYGVYQVSSRRLRYASGGHPPALLFSRSDHRGNQVDLLRTANFIMGGEANTAYRSASIEIDGPARLYVFSDGVYDIEKTDGAMWGFNAFLAYCKQRFRLEQSNLDHLSLHAQDLARKERFDDDFTIVEILFD